MCFCPILEGCCVFLSCMGLSGTSVWRPQSRYTMSCLECRIKFPQNQRCRAKIALQIKVSHLSPDPPVALSSHSQQAGGAAGWWMVSALQGGIAATVTPIALLCATKVWGQVFPKPLLISSDFPPWSLLSSL